MVSFREQHNTDVVNVKRSCVELYSAVDRIQTCISISNTLADINQL